MTPSQILSLLIAIACAALMMAFTLLHAGCVAKPPAPVPPLAGKYRNACLPEAAAMTEGLRAKGITAKAIAFTYGPPAERRGHAFAAYLYPAGANQLWGWDSWVGSTRLRAWWEDEYGIAKAFTRAAGYPPPAQAEVYE